MSSSDDDLEQHPATTATQEAVDAYWNSIGTADPHVIGYMVNPMFLGAPPWPNTRQAYRIVRTPSTVIIASDGLSDPAPDGATGGSGFGCEVFIETSELHGASFGEISGSPFFQLIESFARDIADVGGISAPLHRLRILSTELPFEGDLPHFLTTDGRVGGLIGLPTGRPGVVEAPLGPVDIVPLTVISPADLVRVVEEGAEGRASVAQERTSNGSGHLSTLRTG